MMTIGIIFEIGILWFLITLFTGSTDTEQSFRETWGVIFGVMMVGLISRLVLDQSLRPLPTLIQLVALYFLVGWSCGTDRRTTLKICGAYLLATLAMSKLVHFLSHPA